MCLLKCANAQRADSSANLREHFLEGFIVEPWQTITVLRIPQEFLPDHKSILFAEAPTEFRADPIATAWASGAHDRELQTPSGEIYVPKAMMKWMDHPPTVRGKLASATILLHAMSPIVDGIVVPRGNWVTVNPMLISLPPGESE